MKPNREGGRPPRRSLNEIKKHSFRATEYDSTNWLWRDGWLPDDDDRNNDNDVSIRSLYTSLNACVYVTVIWQLDHMLSW